MIVGVFNTKGGVGKSTLALNLAAGYAADGDVLLVDGDRQGTLLTALGERPDTVPHIASAHWADGKLLRAQITDAKKRYRNIVIDAGGRDSTAMRAGLMVCDVVLIPFLPRSFDVWAVKDMAELVDEAHAVRDNLRAWAVLNEADPQGSDNLEAAEAIQDIDGIVYLDARIGRRKAFADLSGSGMGILDRPERDRKAAAELSYLLQSITT